VFTQSSASTSEEGTTPPATATPLQDNDNEALRILIAEYIGVEKTEIPKDTIFADLLLDCLTSLDFAESICPNLNWSSTPTI